VQDLPGRVDRQPDMKPVERPFQVLHSLQQLALMSSGIRMEKPDGRSCLEGRKPGEIPDTRAKIVSAQRRASDILVKLSRTRGMYVIRASSDGPFPGASTAVYSFRIR